MKRSLYIRLIQFALFIILIFVDQITKFLTRSILSTKDIVIIKDALKLVFLKNTGAVFGVFRGKTLILTVFSIIVMLIIILIFRRIPFEKKYIPLQIISVFILAGAAGNLIDRIFLGYVTDMIYIELINFPVFNIADCYITVSVVVLIFLIAFKYNEHELDCLIPSFRKSGDKDNGGNKKDNSWFRVIRYTYW